MFLSDKWYDDDTKILFHGSQCGTIFQLEPHISLEFKKRVYATDDLKYALVRAGRQLDLIREEYYGIDKPMEIAECYPGAFDQQFNCKGYIYILNAEDFKRDPETGEYYSEEPVTPLDRMDVDNIWFKMMQIDIMKKIDHGTKEYDIHDYYDEEYWKTVRGGLEGFLMRKHENKQKMLELRQIMLDNEC